MKYYTVLIMALTSLALTGFWHRLRSRLPRWNVLTNAQKVALVSFISLTVMLPIITLATLTETRLSSRAETPVTPVTPPVTPTPTPGENQVSWITNTVSLQADNFNLTANDGNYLDNTPDVRVSSDPGSPQYTTLEVTWIEKNVEMRLYMYFHADQNQWWVSEIRTYNGNARGDWIYYTGPFFTTPLGQTFTGNVGLISDPGQNIPGSILFGGLRLRGFTKTVPTPTPTPARFIQVKLPNGGETLYVGQTYRISWDSSSNIDKVWLGYTTGPGSLNWIATNIPNTGFYDWKVFVGSTTNTKFKIDITGYQTGYGSAHDQSDDFFTVLSSPPPTLTPTPTPSPTPTPTPPPTPNIAPRIKTWFLKPGRINRNYRINIVGTDQNKNDQLTMTTTGLPPGIFQGPCSTQTEKKNVKISCVLSGRPTATGTYPVRVILEDNHGGKTENTLLLVIYNLFGLL